MKKPRRSVSVPSIETPLRRGMMKLIKKWSQLLGLRQRNNGSKRSSWGEKVKSPYYQKWLIGIMTTLLLALLLLPTLSLPIKEYRIGDIATKEIKATQDLLVEDENSTREKRMEAEKSVLSVYDYDPSLLVDAENRIRSTFAFLSSSLQKGKNHELEAQRLREWDASIRLPLNPNEWRLLEKEKFNPLLGERILKLITPLFIKGIVNDKDLLDPEATKGVIIRNVQTRLERKDLPPFHFLDYKEAKSKLRGETEPLSTVYGKEMGILLIKISEHFLRPNLTFNKDETETRKTEAREKVNPVYFQVKRGEVILRAGEKVREEHLLKISALKKAQERGHLLSILAGLTLLSFLILVILHEFSTKNIRKIAPSRKDLIFFCSTLVGTIGSLKLFQLITDILGGELLSIPSSSYIYLFPIAAGAMLIRIVLNSEVAIVYAILSSYFSAVLIGNQLFFFIFCLIGSLIGAHRVARCEQRSILIKAGWIVGGVNLLTLFSSHLITGAPIRMTLLSDGIMGFLAGPISSVVLLGITPIIESLFNYTTDIKLLELANMDHPLLKDMAVQAPGTYHHSIVVGSLAEEAAKSISANPLLVRVSSYYHDIGKLKKPLYFIENVRGMEGMENRHDHLSPSMSSLILISHIKDGVELASEHRLGERITNIIRQHHGTSLITYFYQKAKEKENQEMDPIEEKDFRYPGPKPQTKEAGIVMLADAVEAASRTLTDPTASRLRGLVQQIIRNIFLDGQLEECELTLKDLQKIEESFSRILTAIFHQRIDYPSLSFSEFQKKKNDENLDQKSAKTYPLRLKKDKKNGPKDIEQLRTS
jgi:putative nucleotidyltransferase with HDIG domain